MKIHYLRDVSWPSEQAGKAGEEREVSAHIAHCLITGGFAQKVEELSNVKQGTDFEGQRLED